MLEKQFFGKSLEQLLCLVSIFGVLQFILLTFVAGIFYPGGYDYGGYYFSDLGAVMARNGDANLISSKIFTVTLTVVALTFVPFWVIIRSLFTESRVERVLSNVGSALGLLSSPFIVGVGMYPIDTKLETHFIVTLTFFSLFTVATLLYSIAIILNQKHPNHLGITGLILFGLSILVYLNPLAPYVAFLQNVLAYGYFVWILIPIKLLWSHNKMH
ncbi:MAG: hypothetical protein KAJ19_22365 [Gammaproteobacteria bacterium]|nr:hypothetical protein [Gammaproteobacteria bacterium]